MRFWACFPTIISNNPGRGPRPLLMVSSGRSLNEAGVTPRIPILVNSPSGLGSATTATSSGDTRGVPSPPRAIRGSFATQSPAALLNEDPSSDIAPFSSTMAFSGLPLARRARRNPLAIESNPTKTATTNPIPVMASKLDFQRTTTLRRLYLIGTATLTLPQQFCDSCAVGKNGREPARDHPQKQANQDSDRSNYWGHVHFGKAADQIAHDRDIGQYLNEEPPEKQSAYRSA